MKSYTYTLDFEIDGIAGSFSGILRAGDAVKILHDKVPKSRRYLAKFPGNKMAMNLPNTMTMYIWNKGLPPEFQVVDNLLRKHGHIRMERLLDGGRCSYMPYLYHAKYHRGMEIIEFKSYSLNGLAIEMEKTVPIIKDEALCVRFYGSEEEQRKRYSFNCISKAIRSTWRNSIEEDKAFIRSEDIRVDIWRESTED